MNANQNTPNTPLRGQWLLAARISWIGVAALTLGLVTVGVVVAFDRPDLIPQPSARAIFGDAGVPDQVTIVAFLMPTVAFAATSLLIFWHRSDDWAAMLFALMLMTSSVIVIRTEWALEQAVPWLELPVQCVIVLGMFLVLIVLFVFPDGRFVPRWTRLLGAAAIPAAVLLEDVPRLLVELRDGSQAGAKARFGLTMLIWSVFSGAGLYAQVYRYRHVSGPVQRQQTKWVALTLRLLFLVMGFGITIPSLFGLPDAWFIWTLPAVVAASILFPASIAVAILRHHLYDIDRLLSRTLTYGLLTIVLGSLYASAVVVLGQTLNPQGGDSPLAVAASTLLVAALFQPLRRRIQIIVDRRSTGAATTRPRPSRRSAPGSASRWTWTRSRPSCWVWLTRRCSQPRRRCGFDPSLTRRRSPDSHQPSVRQPWSRARVGHPRRRSRVVMVSVTIPERVAATTMPDGSTGPSRPDRGA